MDALTLRFTVQALRLYYNPPSLSVEQCQKPRMTQTASFVEYEMSGGGNRFSRQSLLGPIANVEARIFPPPGPWMQIGASTHSFDVMEYPTIYIHIYMR